MRLTSSAFGEAQPIPKKYTEDGENLSPPLRWTDVPEGVREFAMVVDDPDAPREDPWVHWVLYKIPGDVTELPEGIPQRETLQNPSGTLQGVNSFDQNNVGYRGPAPPPGHGTHHYHFRIYALDRPLDLGPQVHKEAVLDLVHKAKILGQAELVGTYER